MRKTLGTIILATAALVGCKDGNVSINPAVMNVTPTDRAERSPVAYNTSGSYTFPFVSDGLKGCAYRSGKDIRNSIGNVTAQDVNRRLEFESMVVNRQYKNQWQVSFTTNKMTPEGCYVIHTFDTR